MPIARWLLVLLSLVVACGGRSASYETNGSSPDAAGSPGSPAAGASGGSANGGAEPSPSGGSTTTSTGGSGGNETGGQSSGGTPATGGSAGSGDPNCYPGLAVSGAECTAHCSIPCGFADLGTRTCTCTGGYYSSCHCPRPPEYLGAGTAPPCDTPDGRALPLKNTPCDVEWEQCIGNDPVESTNPRGCACLANPLNEGHLMWFCGSTNRWFSPE